MSVALHGLAVPALTAAGAAAAAPEASFAFSPASPVPGRTVTFTDASVDFGADIVSWSWAFGDGASSTEQNPTHRYAAPGAYAVTLTVADAGGLSGTYSRHVLVANRDSRPLFNATAAIVARPVTFTDASTDPDTTLVSWSWSFGDGSSASCDEGGCRYFDSAGVRGNTSSGRHPVHSYATAGAKQVTLTVTDDLGATKSHRSQVLVQNAASSPYFTFEPGAPVPGTVIAFSESSSDPDTTLVNWSWSFGDGTAAYGRHANHSYATSGTRQVTLTVRDDVGATASYRAQVVVQNAEPTPFFDHSPKSANPGEAVSFTDGSTDPDTALVNWSWSFGDGAVAYGRNVTHAFATAGTKEVTLTVKDDQGVSKSFRSHVLVQNAESVPHFTFEPAAPAPGNVVRFAENSTDVDTALVNWSWSLGDGATAFGRNVSHAYAAAGTYEATLTVREETGATKALRRYVVVRNDGTVPSFTHTAAESGVPVTFSGSAHDPDSSVVNWTWAMGDGTTRWGQNVTHAYASPGEYEATLTTRDDFGQTASQRKHVLVSVTGPQPDFTVSPTVVVVGSAAQFTASPSGASAYYWEFDDGSGSHEQNPRKTFGAPGTYNVYLRVTSSGVTNDIRKDVIVVNRAAQASFVHTAAVANQPVKLWSTATDPDTAINAYYWEFGDGSGSHERNPTKTWGAAGTYSVFHRVTDAAGAQASTRMDVVVANRPSVPHFVVNPRVVHALSEVQLNSTSTDPDTAINAYYWEFGDGSGSHERNPKKTWGAAGTYSVFHRVTDSTGVTAAVRQDVVVVNEPTRPRFEISPTFVNVRESVSLTSADTDPDTAINAYYWEFGDGSGSHDRNPTKSWGSAGTYSVYHRATDAAGVASEVRQDVVVVNWPSRPAFRSSPEFPVVGQQVQFTEYSSDPDTAITAWYWEFGDGSGSHERNPKKTYGAPGTYSVYLRVTDSAGVTTDLRRDIIVENAASVPSFTHPLAVPDRATQLTDTSTDLDTTITAWYWEFGDGSGSHDRNPTKTWSAAGRYSVYLRVTDAHGKATDTRQDVVVANRPTAADFSYAPALPVGGLPVAFTDASVDADTTLVSWAWSFGDGGDCTITAATGAQPGCDATVSGANATYTYAANGTYSVTLTVTDEVGATSTRTRSLDVGNRPSTVAFSASPATALPLRNVTFTDASTDTDTRIVAWRWDFGDGASAVTRNATHAYAATGTYTVNLTVTDELGATASAVASYVIANAPTVVDFAFGTAVQGRSVAFADLSTDADTNLMSWSWDFGGGATSTERNPSHAFAANGTHAVALTVTDELGATASATKDVVVANARSVVAFTAGAAVQGRNVTFTDASTDADTTIVAWNWSFGDGAYSSQRHPAHAYAANGTFHVRLAVTDDTGAVASATQALVVANAPTAVAFTASPSTVKPGQTVTFTDESTDADTEPVTWRWDFGDGGTASTRNASHAYASAGTYVVSLTVTDDVGAVARGTESVVAMTDLPPIAAFAVSPATPRPGATVAFTDASTDPDSTLVAWAWDFGDGSSSTARHPSHAYAAPGAYAVRLVVTTDNGATAEASAVLTVAANVAPSAAFTASATSVRPGVAVAFTDASSDADGTVVAWAWDFGDGNGSTERSPMHAYAATGSHTVTLTVTDNEGATASASTVVTVAANGAPTAAFSAPDGAVRPEVAVAFADASSDAEGPIAAWQWDFGDGSASTDANPTHAYATSGAYAVTLTVTDGEGATAAATRVVTVAANGAPTAAFTASATSVAPGVAVAFTDASADAEGAIATWLWEFGDGGTATTADAARAYASPGTYTVRLTVTDGEGATAAATLSIVVEEPAPSDRAPPAWPAGAELRATSVGRDTVTLEWPRASDASGVRGYWLFDDSASTPRYLGPATGTSRTLTGLAPGTEHRFRVVAVDSVGNYDLAGPRTTVSTLPPAVPPIAAIVANLSDAAPGEPVTFRDESVDPDGRVVARDWSVEGRRVADADNVTHAFPMPGTHRVRLDVADDEGTTASTVLNFTVTADDCGTGRDASDAVADATPIPYPTVSCRVTLPMGDADHLALSAAGVPAGASVRVSGAAPGSSACLHRNGTLIGCHALTEREPLRLEADAMGGDLALSFRASANATFFVSAWARRAGADCATGADAPDEGAAAADAPAARRGCDGAAAGAEDAADWYAVDAAEGGIIRVRLREPGDGRALRACLFAPGETEAPVKCSTSTRPAFSFRATSAGEWLLRVETVPFDAGSGSQRGTQTSSAGNVARGAARAPITITRRFTSRRGSTWNGN